MHVRFTTIPDCTTSSQTCVCRLKYDLNLFKCSLQKGIQLTIFLKDLNVTSIRPIRFLVHWRPLQGWQEVCGSSPLGKFCFWAQLLYFFYTCFYILHSTYYTINNNLPRHNKIMTCKRNSFHCVLSKDTHKLVFKKNIFLYIYCIYI